MENKDYKLIDQYLRGELDEEGMKEVNAKRQLDAAFEEELSFQEETQQFLKQREKRAQLKAQLQQLKQEQPDTKQEAKVVPFRRRNLYIIGIAASIAFVLLFAYPFLFPSDLYQQFNDHQALNLQTRGDSPTAYQVAEQAFNSGDFATAYTSIKTIIASDTVTTAYHQIALGIAALETDRLAEAKTIFTQVGEGQSVFTLQAQWYLALTYVKQKDNAAARSILEVILEEPWKGKAQRLLQKL
jgi:hypothetical protein